MGPYFIATQIGVMGQEEMWNPIYVIGNSLKVRLDLSLERWLEQEKVN